MKKLTFIITVFISAIFAGCSNSSSREADLYQMLKQSRDSLHYYQTISKYMQSDLHAYEVYFKSTETMLDSLGIDKDSPILETDAGSHYLDALDGIQNTQPSSSYNQIKVK